MHHFIDSADLTKENCDEILRRSRLFESQGIPSNIAQGKVIAMLFLSPSTRTLLGYQSAIIKMGGGWIGSSDASMLSISKGESLQDTIVSLGNMANTILLRHPENIDLKSIAKKTNVSIVNCGCGKENHVASALSTLLAVDYYKKGNINGLKIGIYGAVGINRVIKSFLPIMGYYDSEIIIDDFGLFNIPEDVVALTKNNGKSSIRYDKLENFISDVDVLFVVRKYQESATLTKEQKEFLDKNYLPIRKNDVQKMKTDAIVYMIKPRTDEIDIEVDSDSRAVYNNFKPDSVFKAAILSCCLGLDV